MVSSGRWHGGHRRVWPEWEARRGRSRAYAGRSDLTESRQAGIRSGCKTGSGWLAGWMFLAHHVEVENRAQKAFTVSSTPSSSNPRPTDPKSVALSTECGACLVEYSISRNEGQTGYGDLVSVSWGRCERICKLFTPGTGSSTSVQFAGGPRRAESPARTTSSIRAVASILADLRLAPRNRSSPASRRRRIPSTRSPFSPEFGPEVIAWSTA